MRHRFFWHKAALSVILFSTVLLAMGCHSSASGGPTKVVLQADWYPQPEHGGFYNALIKGYYKDEGLDVTIQPGGPYNSVSQQVSAGTAQFGMLSSDMVLEAVADGQPVIAVAATMQHDPQGIMVRKDSPIKSFADLNGHTVAVKAGSTWFEYLEKRYQLNDVHEIPATMSVANFIADPQYIQQAFATSEPYFAQKAGVATRIMLTSDAGYNPYRVMLTSTDFLRQHPGSGRWICASVAERLARIFERSGGGKRGDRKAQSGSESRLDAIYLAGFARWAFRCGRRSQRGAARTDGPGAMEHDVQAADRFEGD